jgi:hypothetical protein
MPAVLFIGLVFPGGENLRPREAIMSTKGV